MIPGDEALISNGAESSSSVDWYRLHEAIPTRCRVPARVLAGLAFQEDPFAVDIEWVRQEHGGFLEVLSRMESPAERAEAFHAYALKRFWAHETVDATPQGRERSRYGYIPLLRGWGHDSNGPSGAVLKGWAEQRFGLRPIWHGHRMRVGESEQDAEYLTTRLKGYLDGIGMQLDLLYTYCQDELRRRFPGRTHLTLYRGCYDPDQHFCRQTDEGEVVEFNAVSSFTFDREVAWEFGSTVWRVEVPMAKILLVPGILPPQLLQGEAEALVLGGEYLVQSLLY
jgi:NAD+--dinitrogen-reductase ADP-D-ribosyltransferase